MERPGNLLRWLFDSRHGPPGQADPALDLSALARADLSVGVLLPALPDQGAYRAARHPARAALPRGSGPVCSRNPLLVCAVAILAVEQLARLNDSDVDRPVGVHRCDIQPLAPSQLLRLLRLLPLVRRGFRRVFELPVGRNAARSGISQPLLCAARPAAWLGCGSPTLPSKSVLTAVGVVSHLLRIRDGEVAQRRSAVARSHSDGRVLPERSPALRGSAGTSSTFRIDSMRPPQLAR